MKEGNKMKISDSEMEHGFRAELCGYHAKTQHKLETDYNTDIFEAFMRQRSA